MISEARRMGLDFHHVIFRASAKHVPRSSFAPARSSILRASDAGAWFGRMSTDAEHQHDATFDVEAYRLRFCRQFLAERQIIAW